MRRFVSIALLSAMTVAGPVAWKAAAAADARPHRRSGLWETTMTVAQRSGNGIHSQQCIDEHADEALHPRSMGNELSMKCEQTDFKRVPEGFVGGSVCKSERSTLTSKIRVTGDFQNAYRMEISTHRDPPIGSIADTQSVIDAKWVGNCPPDMKPGDMRVNGRTLPQTLPKGGPNIDPQAMQSMTPAQRLEYIRSRMGGGAPP